MGSLGACANAPAETAKIPKTIGNVVFIVISSSSAWNRRRSSVYRNGTGAEYVDSLNFGNGGLYEIDGNSCGSAGRAGVRRVCGGRLGPDSAPRRSEGGGVWGWVIGL